ncbi:rCG32659 [Rattus norvegicus]|nr:rCG32659 [Rattus norvegicus]
MGMALAP